MPPPVLGDHVADAIRLEAVSSQKFFRRSGVEVGGLLMANPDSGAQLRVEGLELVPCEHLYGPTYHLSRLDCQGLKTQAAIIKASGLKIAGYFRICLRPEFAVMPEDVVVVQDLVPEAQFILIAKPLSRSISTARLFRPGDDHRWSQYQEFELREPDAADSGVPAAISSMIQPLRFKTLCYAAAILLGILNVTFVAWDRLQPRTSATVPDLGLSIEARQNDLRLTWDRNIAPVRLAKSGKLTVDDNGQHREFMLDARQVAHGSVIYAPNSNDVSFRLDVMGKNAQAVTGNFRVFNLMKPELPREELVAAVPEPPAAGATPVRKHKRSQIRLARAPRTLDSLDGLIIPARFTEFREQPAVLDAPPVLAADVQAADLPISLDESAIPQVKHAPRKTAKVFRAFANFFTAKP